MPRIRRLLPDDWALLRQLRLAALLDAPEAFGGSYEHSAQRDEAGWRTWPGNGAPFVAVSDEGEPVGMAAGVLVEAPAGEADLIAMWVAPAARGTGVADDLIAAVLDWAAEQGCTAVGLEVAPGNARAERTYRRNGFVETDEVGSTCGGRRFRVVTADRVPGPR
jgi:GNAT superfamily N-acetyltransferase